MSGEMLTKYLLSLGFEEEEARFLTRLGYWTAILRVQCSVMSSALEGR
jgi:hypothetical protein